MKKREFTLDILKSIAVVLMSFVHVNSLLYSGGGILDKITFLGATVCFSVFLFSIGFVSGKKMGEKKEDSWAKILKKSLWIYLVYILFGVFSFFLEKRSVSFKDVLNIAILQNLPEYTEFLISIIFFTILSKLLFKPFQKLLYKPYLLVEISLLFFIIGSILCTIDISQPVLIWFQKHLVGLRNGTHVFPVFQYLSIYTMGVLFARYKSKITYSWVFSLSFLLLVVLMALGAPGWYRWPPSLNFQLYGVIFISLILFLLEFIKEKPFMKYLTVFGRNTLISFIFLTTVTFVLALFVKDSSDSSLLLWSLNIGVLFLTYLSIYFLKK